MKILGKKRIDKDLVEISFSELLSVTGGIIGGVFLVGLLENFSLVAGLFILFPGLLEMHGNIYGSLSARLSNLLLLGKLNDKRERNYFIRQNIIASFFLVLFISFILGLISYLFIYLVFGVNNAIIIYVSVLSSILGSFVEVPLTIYTTFWFYRHKFDPEDVMGPYVTTLGDIISIVSLVVVIGVLI